MYETTATLSMVLNKQHQNVQPEEGRLLLGIRAVTLQQDKTKDAVHVEERICYELIITVPFCNEGKF